MFSNYTGTIEEMKGKVNEIKSGYNVLLQIKNRTRSASSPFFKRLIENVEARLVDIMNIAFPPLGQVANRMDQLWLFAHRKEIETALIIFKELRSRYHIPWNDTEKTGFDTLLENLSIEKIYDKDYKAGGTLAQINAYTLGTATTSTAAWTSLRLGKPLVTGATVLVGCASTLIGGAYAKRYGGKGAAQVAENANRRHFGLEPA
ncbi:MAG: hypothetical protein JSR33_04525 [Proteobacteria bacterium]|nr:hypothetical protein [Pseudomonadota bacterium]